MRNGQRLIINDENFGLADNFVAGEGSELQLIDGRIGSRLKAVGSQVTIQDGNVGGDFRAFHGATVNIEGGVVGNIWRAFDDSVTNISGGHVADFRPQDDASVNISGGRVEDFFATGNAEVKVTGGEFGRSFSLNQGVTADISGGNFGFNFGAQGSILTISGGAFGDDIRIYDGSTTTFQGFDFRINNVPIAGLASVGDATNIELGENDFFSGVFADGTPFAFTKLEQDELYHDPIRLEQAAVLTNVPTLINVPSDTAPLGIRSGQTLVLHEGGTLAENFGAGLGSTIRIEGGTVERNLEAVDADMIVNGGSVKSLLGLFNGSTLTVNGGEIGPLLRTYDGSHVTVNGGRVFDGTDAFEGSMWNVTGGEVDSIQILGTSFTMTGGSVRDLVAGLASNVEINNGETIGVRISTDSTLHVVDGNHAGFSLTSGGSGRIDGGRIHQVTVHEDSVMELHGGNFGVATNNAGGSNSSTPHVGVSRGHLKIFGGAFGDGLSNNFGVLELYGADFQVDGLPVDGLDQPGDIVEIDLSNDSQFSGTLSDGTPFYFFEEVPGRYHVEDSTIRLIRRSPAPLSENVVTVDSGQGPLGARPGQTVILEEGGLSTTISRRPLVARS